MEGGQALCWGLWEIKEEWDRIPASGAHSWALRKSSNNSNLKQNEASALTEVEAAPRGDAEGNDLCH